MLHQGFPSGWRGGSPHEHRRFLPPPPPNPPPSKPVPCITYNSQQSVTEVNIQNRRKAWQAIVAIDGHRAFPPSFLPSSRCRGDELPPFQQQVRSQPLFQLQFSFAGLLRVQAVDLPSDLNEGYPDAFIRKDADGGPTGIEPILASLCQVFPCAAVPLPDPRA